MEMTGILTVVIVAVSKYILTKLIKFCILKLLLVAYQSNLNKVLMKEVTI